MPNSGAFLIISFNPRMRIGEFIAEPLVINESMPRVRIEERVQALLGLVGLSSDAARLFPVVLDEPVSALDVSIRAQIMNLLQDLQQQFGLSYLLIAHDLAAVLHLSTTIAVMYLGKIVELGTSEVLRTRPRHPYTQALFAAALPAHPDEQRSDITITGEAADPIAPPSGCRFHLRCPFVAPICVEVEPLLRPVAGRHDVACHLVGES